MRTAGGGVIFALLADNTLVEVSPEDGRLRGKLSLDAPLGYPASGRYLEQSKDGKTLFVLVPRGSPDGASELMAVDVVMGRVRDRYALEGGVVFRSLAVGPKTGRLYLFGNRPGGEIGDPAGNNGEEAAVVTVLDPDDRRVLRSETVREAGGRAWSVYRGEVSPDERRLFIAYHGDTEGADWITIAPRGLDRCRKRVPAYRGCIPAHGEVEAYGDRLLAAASDPPRIVEMGREGELAREWDTKLEGNHMADFAVDAGADRLYALGSCGYTGGLSRIDLETRRVESLVPTQAGSDRPSERERAVCGERLALGPGSLLVVGKTARVVPQAEIPGSLLLIDGDTGEKVRAVDTPSEPVDVLVVSSP